MAEKTNLEKFKVVYGEALAYSLLLERPRMTLETIQPEVKDKLALLPGSLRLKGATKHPAFLIACRKLGLKPAYEPVNFFLRS